MKPSLFVSKLVTVQPTYLQVSFPVDMSRHLLRGNFVIKLIKIEPRHPPFATDIVKSLLKTMNKLVRKRLKY